MGRALFYAGAPMLLVAVCGTPHLQMQANDSGSDDSHTSISELSLAPSSPSNADNGVDCFVQLIGAYADDPDDTHIRDHLRCRNGVYSSFGGHYFQAITGNYAPKGTECLT